MRAFVWTMAALLTFSAASFVWKSLTASRGEPTEILSAMISTGLMAWATVLLTA